MSNIIIPSNIDEASVRVPMQFPLRAQDDSVVDAEGREVFTMSESISIGESLKFTKLFAKAPEMFQILGDAYVLLTLIAKNSGETDHGSEGEDKEKCLLCRMESVLGAMK
jgi:hypothetical protein